MGYLSKSPFKAYKNKNLKIFSSSIKQIINNMTINNSLKSLILTPPSYKTFQNTLSNYDPLDLYELRNNHLIKFYKNFEDDLCNLFKNLLENLIIILTSKLGHY